MCNKTVLTVAAVAAAVYFTGGTALAGMGGTAAAGTTTVAAGSVAAGTTAAATTAATTGAAASTAMTATQTAAMYASAAGAGMSAYGAYQQSESAQKAADYNAKLAKLQGQDALDRGDLDQQAIGRKQAALRGSQAANMAANGLDLSYGSPAALLDQTDYYGNADQETAANNARREAAGYGSRATMSQIQADSYSPMMSGAGSLLTSSGTVADRWYKYGGK